MALRTWVRKGGDYFEQDFGFLAIGCNAVYLSVRILLIVGACGFSRRFSADVYQDISDQICILA